MLQEGSLSSVIPGREQVVQREQVLQREHPGMHMRELSVGVHSTSN